MTKCTEHREFTRFNDDNTAVIFKCTFGCLSMDDINTPFCNHIIFSPFDQMKEKCNSATCDKTSERFPVPVGLEGTAALHTPPQLPPINGGSPPQELNRLSCQAQIQSLPGGSAGCSEALWCQPGLHAPLRTPPPSWVGL